MAQFSVEIMRPPGSVLAEKQHWAISATTRISELFLLSKAHMARTPLHFSLPHSVHFR
jgi:hypothetical protein